MFFGHGADMPQGDGRTRQLMSATEAERGNGMHGQPSAEKARELEARGRARDAIREWSLLNRANADDEIEQRIVVLRHEAARTNRQTPVTSSEHPADPFPDCSAYPPSIPAHVMSAALIRGAIVHHGCVLVRNLIDGDTAAALRDAIDAAFDARQSSLDGAPTSATAPWFVPDPCYASSDSRAALQRALNFKLNAVLAVDSPRTLFLVAEALEVVGIPQLLKEYFGEEVLLSVEKSTLRRVRPGPAPAWHQDGSFLGTGVHALDIWVALSECGEGTDASGLEIVPRRLNKILEHGVGDARTGIEITPEQIADAAEGVGVACPTFEPGDALLFDEMFLHRTMPGRSRTRYALELWSFGASSFPDSYAPIAL